MTLSLRRKPQITARNTLPATARSAALLAWGAATLVLVVASHAWAEPTGWRAAGAAPATSEVPRILPPAGESRPIREGASRPGIADRAYCEAEGDVNRGAVVPASYATGEAGGRLKWLPRRKGRVIAASGLDSGEPGVITAGPGAVAFPGEVERAVTSEEDPSIPQTLEPDPTGELLLPAFPTAQDAVQAPDEMTDDLNEADLAPPETESDEDVLADTGDLEAQLRRCPKPEDFKKITEITTEIEPEKGDFPYECRLLDSTAEPRAWCSINYTWTAAQIGHKPLYFEDVQLERYGHSCGPYLQPFASMGHFFLTIPVLPYKMGLEPPNECIYDLGYYRPGNCAPYMLDPLPLSVRAALFEAGVWTGGVFLFP